MKRKRRKMRTRLNTSHWHKRKRSFVLNKSILPLRVFLPLFRSPPVSPFSRGTFLTILPTSLKKHIPHVRFFFLPRVSGVLSRSLRATPFSSNGSAFFTSKRVFHTHVTGSVKTGLETPAYFPSIVAGDRDKGWNYNLSSTLERAGKVCPER